MNTTITRRGILAVPLAAAAVSMAASCGFGNTENPNQNPGQEPAPGGESGSLLREAWRPVNHLNPAFGGGGSPDSTVIMFAMWEGLVIRDPQDSQNYLPGAAESWESSEDGTVWTFHLRDGAQWSNGDPLTANDFVWAASYFYSPKLGDQGDQNPVAFKATERDTSVVGLPDYFSGATEDFSTVGIEAEDDTTLVITLTGPDYRFLDSTVKLFPLHQASVEANPRDFWMPENFVGNGTYILESYNQNSSATLTVNPNHWDSPSYTIQTRELQFNSSGPTGMMVNYNADEIDIFRADGDPSALIAGRPELEEEMLAGTLVQFKGLEVLPCKNPILEDNPQLREALSMAVDREALASVSPPDVAGPSWVPSGITGSDTLPAIPFDVDGAKQLLSEAGFADGEGIPELSILTYETMPVLEAVASMWKENLGIDTKVLVQEVGVYSGMLGGDLPEDFVGYAFNYQAPTPFNMMRYGGHPYFEDIFIPYDIKKQIYDIRSGKDKDKYSPAESVEKIRELLEENWIPEYQNYVSLMEKAQDAQADPDEAAALAGEAAVAFQEIHYWIPLLWAGYTFMVKPRIKGLTLTSYADNIYSMKGVTIDAAE